MVACLCPLPASLLVLSTCLLELLPSPLSLFALPGGLFLSLPAAPSVLFSVLSLLVFCTFLPLCCSYHPSFPSLLIALLSLRLPASSPALPTSQSTSLNCLLTLSTHLPACPPSWSLEWAAARRITPRHWNLSGL